MRVCHYYATTVATIMAKSSKLDNVLVNVVVAITTHNQIPEQEVFRECELVKAKATID